MVTGEERWPQRCWEGPRRADPGGRQRREWSWRRGQVMAETIDPGQLCTGDSALERDPSHWLVK